MDPIEARLIELAEGLKRAWQSCQDAASPLGYWAAVAAATLVFYQERGRERSSPPERIITAQDREHWSDEWKRRHE